jgi:hypothetical protein
MDLTILQAVGEAKREIAEDVMWVRDDLREALLAQANEIKRLQAVVWALTQLTAEKLGVSTDDLTARVARAVAEVSGPRQRP